VANQILEISDDAIKHAQTPFNSKDPPLCGAQKAIEQTLGRKMVQSSSEQTECLSSQCLKQNKSQQMRAVQVKSKNVLAIEARI